MRTILASMFLLFLLVALSTGCRQDTSPPSADEVVLNVPGMS